MGSNDNNSDSDPSSGFSHIDRVGTLADGRPYRVRLLIPTALKEALEAEERRQEILARWREEVPAPLADNSAEAASKTYEQRQREKQAAAELAETVEQKALWQAHSEGVGRRGRCSRHAVFEPQQALALHERMKRYQKDERARFERIYEQLSAVGHMRKIARASDAALQQLAASQPHMAPVVEFVQDQVELARRARKAPRIAPILLAGEPGIGKTFFAQGLAAALGAPLSVQRLDTDVTGSLMLGSDRKWSTSQNGLLFELLALGKAANPVILLDEIDKVNRIDQAVQSCLYSLLEPVSAGRVRDISLDFELDASLVTWIATANESRRLDQPLRSRFKEFHIQVPTASECLVLAREVVRATIRNTAVRGFSLETNRLECDLAHLPARQIQQITREAMARALKSGRMTLRRQDLPPEFLDSDESRGSNGSYLH